jgi:hypothetical protein
VDFHSFLIGIIDARLGRITLKKGPSLSIKYEAGVAPEPVWTFRRGEK